MPGDPAAPLPSLPPPLPRPGERNRVRGELEPGGRGRVEERLLMRGERRGEAPPPKVEPGRESRPVGTATEGIVPGVDMLSACSHTRDLVRTADGMEDRRSGSDDQGSGRWSTRGGCDRPNDRGAPARRDSTSGVFVVRTTEYPALLSQQTPLAERPDKRG